MPKFILLAAVSLDGRITRGNEEGTEWTSMDDKRFFERELDNFDAVIMGRGTFEAIEPPLKPRNRIVFTHSPLFQSSVEHWNSAGPIVPFSGTSARLLKLLKMHGWKRVAILGGTSIYDWFLKRGLIDEMYLTLEPVIFGTGKALASVALESLTTFKLLSTKKLNSQGTLLLHYKVN